MFPKAFQENDLRANKTHIPTKVENWTTTSKV